MSPHAKLCPSRKHLLLDGEKCECFARRERERYRDEPWRRLYHLTAWQKARAARRRLDADSCCAVVDGVPCLSSEDLQVHHVVSVVELWRKLGHDWPAFERAACDLEGLRTFCAEHHGIADQARRRDRRRT